MKKRIFSVMMALILILALIPTTVVHANDIRVTINGQQVFFPDQQPTIVDSRTLVPVRGVFEALGFEVDWDGETSTAILERHDYTLLIPIGSPTFTTNGVVHTLDVPAQIIGGRTMLPIRFPLESVGYEVDWDGATRTVIITTRGQAAITDWSQSVTLTDAMTRELNEFFRIFAGANYVGITLNDYDSTDARSVDTALEFALQYAVYVEARSSWENHNGVRIEVPGSIDYPDYGMVFDEHASYEFVSASHIDSSLQRLFGITNVEHKTINISDWFSFEYREGRYYVPMANGGASRIELNVVALYDNGDGTLTARISIRSYFEGELIGQHYNTAIIRADGNTYQLLYWRNRVD